MRYESLVGLREEIAAEQAQPEAVADAEDAVARARRALGDAAAGLAGEIFVSHLAASAMSEGVMAPSSGARVVRELARTVVRPQPLPTVALGVARGRNRQDYFLGARVQGRGPAARQLAARIQAKARGESDVRIVPRLRPRVAASWFRARRRPLESGLSVGLAAYRDAGTLGFVAEDDSGYYVASCNHVLADVDRAIAGDPVVQPGPSDRRPSSSTLIGALARAPKISFTEPNTVDAALATLADGTEFYAAWTEALPGRVRGLRAASRADLDRPVVKAGRSTGITRGEITQVDVSTLRIPYGRNKTARFVGQIEVTGARARPFSAPGDSGSLVVGRDGQALGIVFCGGLDEQGVDLSYANPLPEALAALRARLVF